MVGNSDDDLAGPTIDRSSPKAPRIVRLFVLIEHKPALVVGEPDGELLLRLPTPITSSVTSLIVSFFSLLEISRLEEARLDRRLMLATPWRFSLCVHVAFAARSSAETDERFSFHLQ